MPLEAAPSPIRRIDAPGMTIPPDATWSNCLLVGREVVMSGVTARGRDGRPIGGDSMKAQTLACLDRISRQVEAAGGTRAGIYKLVIYVTDASRKDEINQARAAFFRPLFPCSTLIEVQGFAFPDLLVEIDAFANLDADLNAAAAALKA
jgi:enamine deaminase RidA (YjgF/YER057c/UK114 family)